MMTTPNGCQHRAPGIGLSRFRLTVLLVLVLGLPPLAAFVLTRSLPPAHEWPLAVTVRLVTIDSGAAALDLTNESEDELRSLRVQINDAFHYLPPDPLAPTEQLVLPLEWFAKKSGHRFRPEKWQLETVRVSARLPDNRNAAIKRQF